MLERGRVHVLDALGLALAGARAETSHLARAHVGALGIAAGPATVLGTAMTTAPRFAAFLNGAAMHADNFDDTSPQASPARNGGIHATAAALAAALASAEARRADGRTLTVALHAGIEVACRLNHAIAQRHYAEGFHPTGTLNAFGAAVAAAVVAGLDVPQIEHALAYAASAASGVRRNFGSMVEILHPGLAAETGIVAADLAGRGLAGAPDAIAGRFGYFEAAAGGFDPTVLEGRLGAPWAIVEPGMSIKPFPSGALTHPAMTRLIEVVRREGLAPEDVAEIRVRTNRRVLETLAHHRPASPLEARFSMEFCLAAILVLGEAGLGAFTEATLGRADIRAMMERVRFEAYESPEKGFTNVTTLLDIACRDGRRFAERVDWATGSAQAPMSFAEVAGKFRACAAYAGWPAERAEGLVEAVGRLETLDDAGRLARLAGLAGGAS